MSSSTGYTTVSSQYLQDARGTLVANATITFQPVGNNGQPVSVRAGGSASGQMSSAPIQAQVTNGVFSVQLVDMNVSTPAAFSYCVTCTDNITGELLLGSGYANVQWLNNTGSSSAPVYNSVTAFNFDSYTPIYGPPLTIVQAGPQGPAGPAGPTGATGAPGVTTLSGSVTNLHITEALITDSTFQGSTNFVTPTGLDPTGATDNSALINAAIASSPSGIFLPPGTYYVPSLSNPNGVPIFGDGVLLTSLSQSSPTGTGGATLTATKGQSSSYVDKYRHILGMEHLTHLHKAFMKNAPGNYASTGGYTAILGVALGDSRIAGTNITNAAYLFSNQMQEQALLRGLIGLTVMNSGIGGTTSAQLDASFIAATLSTYPTVDVVTINYGYNDAGLGITPAQTITHIRSACAQLRAHGNVDNLCIILCTPYSGNDTPSGRSYQVLEQLRDGYVQAARDYQCVFVDTYAAGKDADSAITSMDAPYGTGSTPVIHVHPDDARSMTINSIVWDAIFPEGLRLVASNKFINEAGSQVYIAVTNTPSSFRVGLSFNRCMGDFPFDGYCVTEVTPDGIASQRCQPYAVGASGFAFRSSNGASAWYPWIIINPNGDQSGVNPVSTYTDTATGTDVYIGNGAGTGQLAANRNPLTGAIPKPTLSTAAVTVTPTTGSGEIDFETSVNPSNAIGTVAKIRQGLSLGPTAIGAADPGPGSMSMDGGILGGATAPTGSGAAGMWALTQDGKISFCKAGTWEIVTTAP